jgi:hypothetical protein
MSEMLAAILRITRTPAMLVFFSHYVDALRETGQTLEEAVTTARATIGWAYGEGMPPERVRMWRAATGAEHPAGTIEDMTLDEIFEAGKRWGAASKGDLLPDDAPDNRLD